jgi:hypothetical protein
MWIPTLMGLSKDIPSSFLLTGTMQTLPQIKPFWGKMFKLISWNDHELKYDIHDWSADGGKMGKGVTLSQEELLTFKELLTKIEL